jgi:hypothetical protein
MRLLKLKISSKAMLFFLVVSLLPLITVSFVLVSSAHTQFLNAASTKQQIIATDLSGKVDDYLSDKINLLVFQSKIYSLINSSDINAGQYLALLTKQNPDINIVFLLDSNGMQQNGYDNKGQFLKLNNTDQSRSDAFKSVSYLVKPYISSVSYSNNKPYITIAVPVLKPNSTKGSIGN